MPARPPTDDQGATLTPPVTRDMATGPTLKRGRRNPPQQHASKAGQALLESFGVMLLLCMILFGVVQLTLMYTAREVVQYGADASIRARTVGFNDFMVYKVMRVATIPNAGQMTAPNRIPIGDDDAWQRQDAGDAYNAAIRSRGSSEQFTRVEQYTIPLYLGGQNHVQLRGTLNYDEWDTVRGPSYIGVRGATIGVRVSQDYPLRMPMVHRVWSADDSIRLTAEARLSDHADLYLEDY